MLAPLAAAAGEATSSPQRRAAQLRNELLIGPMLDA